MATNFLTKLFGSRNDRLLKTYRKTVERINGLEAQFEKLSDDELRGKTESFKQRIAQGESLDAVLPEAFAVVREGSKRIMKMRHFDVQLVGGLALHHGKVAEMRTGEGKTLTATLPVYLNALTGKGVHVVTVNDYLASRDAQWMGRLYNFLGLSVGINLPQAPRDEKQAAYRSDITYGTNNEYGFDYLRDNMVYEAADRVQRGLNFAIVDEVDSILIDEARTPLIISGQAEDQTQTYMAIKQLVPHLVRQEGEADVRTGEGVIKPGDFTVDEKAHAIHMTEQGHEHAEQLLSQAGLLPEGASLYDPANIALLHNLVTSLKAHHLYHRDQHYVNQNGEIVIVDEFTGRLMTGRRWSDGLHQAVEAKEGVAIQPENQTLASITFQNYFRLYGKLSGMTGTADTEAYEFQEIYSLETVVIPPNRVSKRVDQLDRVYKTTKEKYVAAIQDIRECHERGQPVLVGTSSIENSEIIAELLVKEGLPHEVLNAKQHAREADIIIQAGRPGGITIATNMAGRGTDIVLGGNLEKMVDAVQNDESLDDATKAARIESLRQNWQADHEKVKALGGLRIIATERHESRRIDNQLRGRSGRQGDPGSSRFYLSLDDSLMRIFAGDRVRAIMDRLKMPEGEAIEAGIVTRSIESAQRKVEARNFDIRKQLLEYDDVSNDQRKVIYQQRNDILDAESPARADRFAARRLFCRSGAPVRARRQCGRAVGPAHAGARAARRVGGRCAGDDLGVGRRVDRRGRGRRARGGRGQGGVRGQGADRGRGELHPVRARGVAADHRRAVARAPVRAGLPAPGHPPARLCAEAAQAGVQARGLRAVWPVAGHGEERCDARVDERARAVCRADGAGGRTAGRARRADRQRDLHRAHRDR